MWNISHLLNISYWKTEFSWLMLVFSGLFDIIWLLLGNSSFLNITCDWFICPRHNYFPCPTSSSIWSFREHTTASNRQYAEFNYTILLHMSLIHTLVCLEFLYRFLPLCFVLALCIVLSKLKDNIQGTKNIKYTNCKCVTMTIFTPM